MERLERSRKRQMKRREAARLRTYRREEKTAVEIHVYGDVELQIGGSSSDDQ